MNVIHSPLEENITNLQPSYRQHISRAVLEAVCFQVTAKTLSECKLFLIWFLWKPSSSLIVIKTRTLGC